jgi:trehalose/maltose transport system permease protein
VLLIAFYTVSPFLYAVSISFRTNQQVLLNGARYLPEEANLENFQNLLGDSQFMRTMLNSAIVSSITVLLSLVVGAFAAYALGRVRFRGRMLIMYLVLAMTMFPQISILSGLFRLVKDLGIDGSLLSLTFTYPIFTLPFTVWVLTSFFKGLPDEIEQAALVDGATAFQTFWRILIPLTAPALVTTGLLAFISAWNEYLFALTFNLVSPDSHTVPVAIGQFSGYSYEIPIADRIAGAVVVTVPLLMLVLVFQRRIIEGLTAGAVKG